MRLLAPLSVVVVACAPRPPEVSPEVLGQTAVADLSETLDGIEELYFSVSDSHRSAEPSTAEPEPACVDAVGTCTWCSHWDGDWPGGTFAAQPVAVPCGGDRDGVDQDMAYTVDDGWLEGSWVTAGETWTLSALGGRHATLEPRSDDDDPTLDASWTTDRLSVIYEGERRTYTRATMTYRGGPVTWSVHLAGPADQLVGTLVSDAGDACTVATAVGEGPAVHCSR